jgi:hypothetical protein
MTLAEVVPCGDRVLVRIEPGSPAVDPLYQVYRFRAGQIVRIDDFADRRKARRAAGLEA